MNTKLYATALVLCAALVLTLILAVAPVHADSQANLSRYEREHLQVLRDQVRQLENQNRLLENQNRLLDSQNRLIEQNTRACR